jgi:C1A family cysteine protease
MKAFVVAALLAAPALAAQDNFASWAQKNGKQYKSREEMVLRRSIFAANVAKINAHNAAGQTWSMGVNKFADLTGEEFKARYTGGYRTKEKRSKNVALHLLHNESALPTSVDWNAAGALTPIKNQGDCGSCWSFSTTGAVEGITFITTKVLISASEQQLVDCSGAEGNQGCNGGLMDYAFQYIIDNKGICSEAAYPYKGVDGKCKSTTCTPVATITGYQDVPANSETALMTAVAQQPTSVAVEADQSSFQFYTGGVMTAACGTALDHGVLAAGYGTDATAGDYWFVKNSWGADWGAAGFILLARGGTYNGNSGQCGIQMEPSYPTKS